MVCLYLVLSLFTFMLLDCLLSAFTEILYMLSLVLFPITVDFVQGPFRLDMIIKQNVLSSIIC